ncbi:MAG TPA: glutaredoxin [Alphaproteobacteria bacterium]|nr:glutaredoxin [Alphaproteobacteria bacterium]
MSQSTKIATLYRMSTPDHQCPFGLKARHFLKANGYKVNDNLLKSREQADSFKEEHGVDTTPQVFIDDKRIGGYEDVRAFLGKPLPDPSATSYRPVMVLFMMTALLAIATSWLSFGSVLTVQTIEWFISFSMVVLALLKLQDVEKFSTMFLNYDLLARKWVPYGRIYPFAEGLAGLLMAAELAHIISIPIALFIGIVGSVSVFKAVYLDKRELKCACVGGSSTVPLGFISLTENLMMVAMAVWMIIIIN